MLQPVRQNDLPFAKEPLLQSEEFLDVVYIYIEYNILVKLCQGDLLKLCHAHLFPISLGEIAQIHFIQHPAHGTMQPGEATVV